MTTFKGGPADGQTLMLKRAPVFLRVVREEGGTSIDALDQLDDVANPREELFAYVCIEMNGCVHINRGGGRGGFYPIATYRFLEPQPEDDDMRANESWRDWTRNHQYEAPELKKS